MKWVDLSEYNAKLTALTATSGTVYFRISPKDPGSPIMQSLAERCIGHNMLSKNGVYAFPYNSKTKAILSELRRLGGSRMIDVQPEDVGYPRGLSNAKLSPNTAGTSENDEPGKAGQARSDGRASRSADKISERSENVGSGAPEPDNQDATTDAELHGTTAAGKLGSESGGRRASSPGQRFDNNLVNNNPNHFFLNGETIRTGGFSAAKRFDENRDAIEIAKGLSQEGRMALPEEKSTLVRYNGWGGLSRVLDNGTYASEFWMREAKEWIRNNLNPEDVAAAKASTTNSHFTSPEVAESVWRAIADSGFDGGRILEPSAGSGVFLGTMPVNVARNSFITTIEKDRLTAEVLSHLYPDAKNYRAGYEDVRVPQSSFDLAITNVPFGEFGLSDREYNRFNLPIHDYFIVKSLDRLKAGGIGVFITSRYTMDKSNRSARKLMAERGDLIGAYRMPSNAQTAQAGVRVVTDLLVFRKRAVKPSLQELSDIPWIETGLINIDVDGETASFSVNQYFIDNPDHVLGSAGVTTGQYGRAELLIENSQDIAVWAEQLNHLMGVDFESSEKEVELIDPDAINIEPVDNNPVLTPDDFTGAIPGSYLVSGNDVIQVNDSPNVDGDLTYSPLDVQGKSKERMIGMIAVRDAMNKVIQLQIKEPQDTPAHDDARTELNKIYDSFVQKHGFLNEQVNAKLFREDPESGRLRALESYDSESKSYFKSDVFKTRVLGAVKPPIINGPVDAMNYLLAQTGDIDIEAIANLASLDLDTAMDELSSSGAAFLNPANAKWEVAAKYLSGDVKTKLTIAQEFAEEDPFYERNVAGLLRVQPEDILRGDIAISLGGAWLEEDLIESFLQRIMANNNISVKRMPNEKWLFKAPPVMRQTKENTIDFGTKRMGAHLIIEKMLNGGQIAVYDKIEGADGKSTPVLNEKETMLAQQKSEVILQQFEDYLFETHDRANLTVRLYNDAVNRYVSPEYDGSALTFPGMNATVALRAVQKNSVMRYLQEGRELLAHEVGVGKTYTMVASAIEAKRIGLHNKPMIAVPNHMLEQIHREGLQLYPNARVLAITKEDLKADKRKTFMGRVVNNEWDLIICTHGVLRDLPVSNETVQIYLENELDHLRTSLEAIEEMDGARYSIKAAETKIARAEKRLKTVLEDIEDGKDQGITFEMLGVDMLAIDEYHNFKNLETASASSSLSINGSQRATDLAMKLSVIYDRNGSISGVLPASGTPVSNSIAELHVMLRYFMPDVLAEMEMETIDSWASNFIKFKSSFEPAPGGNGFKLRERPILVNAPELMAIVRGFMDVRTAKEAGIVRPEAKTHIFSTPMTEIQEGITQELAARAEALKDPDVTPDIDNILKIVSEGRQVALHQNLLHGKDGREFDLDDDSFTKVDELVEQVVRIHTETSDVKGAQAVFCDMGTPSAGRKGKFNVYELVKEKLIDVGIPPEEIAFAHDAKTDKKKAELFADVRAGIKRVVLGSTSKMGEGTNMQERLAAIHDLDPPWRPSDIEQRHGRGIRYGNMFTDEGVFIGIYTSKGSFDEYMWTTMKAKNDIFSGILSGDKTHRVFDDGVDPTYAETIAIVTRNPLLKEKMETEQLVNKLQALSNGYERELQSLRQNIGSAKDSIEAAETEVRRYEELPEVEPTGSDGSYQWYRKVEADLAGEEAWEVVDRDVLSAAVGKELKKEKRGDYEITVRFEDQEVIVNREPDRHMAQWRLGDVTYGGSAALQRAFTDREREIYRAHSQIDFYKNEIEKTEKALTEKGPNPFDVDLKKATAKLNEVNEKIANQSSSKPQPVEVEELPEAVGMR